RRHAPAVARRQVPVSPRLTMLLALPCVLSAGAVWTEARDLLARLFSPAETCELGEEVVGGRVEPGARTVVVPVTKKAWEAELGLATEQEAVGRLRALLDTLGRLETHDGFFFNYYDTTSLERTSNFISFVDSSWLTAGLMVVRTAFPELHDECTRLIERADYRFFYDAGPQRMSHGYWVHLAARSRYHYGVLYAESRLGSLIAIGKGDVPEEHWFP